MSRRTLRGGWRQFGWIVVKFGMLAAVGLVGACGGSQGQVEPPSPQGERVDSDRARCPLPLARGRGLPSVPVRLRINNGTDQALAVYLDRCDGHVRLGTVRGDGAAVFRLPQFLFPIQDGLRIHAYLPNQDMRYGSFIVPLDTVPVLHFALSDTSTQVGYGGVPVLGIPEFGTRGEGADSARQTYTVTIRPATRGSGGIPGTFDRTKASSRPAPEIRLGGSVEAPMATAFSADLTAVVTWMCFEGRARLTLFARALPASDSIVVVEMPGSGVWRTDGWHREKTMRPTLVLVGEPLTALIDEMREAPSVVLSVETETEAGASPPRWEFDLKGLAGALEQLPCFAPVSRLP